MVSTRKKRQSNKRLLSQLDDFDQDMITGNAASERQENVVVNEGTNDRDFTVSNSSNNTAVNESAMNVKTLERCFNERIDREMSNIVDTVEDRIQNAILTAIENIVAPKIELAIRSINASSGRDVTSVTANSERGERVGINTSFENASENNNTLRVPNVNDETRLNIPDEVSELSVPETRFDRQPQTHHSGLDWTRAYDLGEHGARADNPKKKLHAWSFSLGYVPCRKMCHCVRVRETCCCNCSTQLELNSTTVVTRGDGIFWKNTSYNHLNSRSFILQNVSSSVKSIRNVF